MDSKALRPLLRMKDPDKILDFLIFNSFNAGVFGNKMPVSDSREVFEHIKKLLKS